MSENTFVQEITLSDGLRFVVFAHNDIRIIGRHCLFGRNRCHPYKRSFLQVASEMGIRPFEFSSEEISIFKKAAKDFVQEASYEKYRNNPTFIFNPSFVFYDAQDMITILRKMKNFDNSLVHELEKNISVKQKKRKRETSFNCVTHNNPIVEVTHENDGVRCMELCFLQSKFTEDGKAKCQVAPYVFPTLPFDVDADQVTVPKRKISLKHVVPKQSVLVSDSSYCFNTGVVLSVNAKDNTACVEISSGLQKVSVEQLFQ